MIISNFVNEIGNKIKIKIQRNTDTATTKVILNDRWCKVLQITQY